ncbi:MAG: 30S ribosomal protein S7 [Candidatus Wildermuthbacteria bacterium RIFCSPHIGHO2_02_FULL_49_9]|uniref:Small ribosomal subunit protein uS7 n=2 Tax=Candidatus Wildermuthiibacteriota TaxID=1817923 RepID=A0A1G2QYT7_9BACT|nr:MAG: 30S ribosomal protein S7 [Candidatus Wildermuthbacteria bacterium RIFCSPHIGHO2_01_FULL_49_22b]OHA70462.1 MAG: 30S ribosomal protein S7 [Candidatus Wildermuthbacteria bacterium RIFCSPHIGHO2_02_FULL_49_9]
MPRYKFQKRVLNPDMRYGNVQVAKFVNHLMVKGKKAAARKIVYKALETIKEKTKKEPLEVFERALENVAPMVEVRSKRVGGATYQVPIQVKEHRKESLAARWIIGAARNKKGKPMAEKLAEELLAAYNREGAAFKKKEDTHRMAEANRAFAHFAW